MVIKDFRAPSPYAREVTPTAGTTEDAVRRNPMCLAVDAVCEACGRQWTAPKIGICPSCHSDRVHSVDTSVALAVRA